jgi:hypothetical protein
VWPSRAASPCDDFDGKTRVTSVRMEASSGVRDGRSRTKVNGDPELRALSAMAGAVKMTFSVLADARMVKAVLMMSKSWPLMERAKFIFGMNGTVKFGTEGDWQGLWGLPVSVMSKFNMYFDAQLLVMELEAT